MFESVVQTLGFNKIITLLLTAPPYVLAVLSIYTCARHADITGERCLHIVLPLCVAIAAFILAAATTALAPRYGTVFIQLCWYGLLILCSCHDADGTWRLLWLCCFPCLDVNTQERARLLF
jgi:MFS family permease